MAGLAVHLGIARQALLHYSTDSEALSNAIRHARDRIEADNIAHGLLGCHDSRISALNLSTNYGYHTREQQDQRVEAVSFNIDFGLRDGQAEELQAARQEIQRLRAEVAQLRALTAGTIKDSDHPIEVGHNQAQGGDI